MTKNEVKEYLEDYNAKCSLAEFKSKHGQSEDILVRRIAIMQECFCVLPDDLGVVLQLLYKDCRTLREVAKAHYCGKDSIARKRDKAISLLSSMLESY